MTRQDISRFLYPTLGTIYLSPVRVMTGVVVVMAGGILLSLQTFTPQAVLLHPPISSEVHSLFNTVKNH